MASLLRSSILALLANLSFVSCISVGGTGTRDVDPCFEEDWDPLPAFGGAPLVGAADDDENADDLELPMAPRDLFFRKPRFISFGGCSQQQADGPDKRRRAAAQKRRDERRKRVVSAPPPNLIKATRCAKSIEAWKAFQLSHGPHTDQARLQVRRTMQEQRALYQHPNPRHIPPGPRPGPHQSLSFVLVWSIRIRKAFICRGRQSSPTQNKRPTC